MKISNKLRKFASIDGAQEGLTYWCQGCKSMHAINTKGHIAWEWDGNAEQRTFSPSVLVTCRHYMPGMPQPPDCQYCKDLEPGDKSTDYCYRCHTFIKGGMVQFLSDCTHEFAGQSVPLPDLPEVASRG